MRKVFVGGQRWLSETEPELGLGMVLNASPNQVTIVFRATGTTRQYSIESAPLKRVLFRVGENVRAGEDNREFQITSVTENNGLVTYEAGSTEIPETLLSDAMLLNAPRARLLAGHVSPSATFELRSRALQFQYETRRSPVRGFEGGRIGLIPHQLYIAAEVTSRLHPRVLLSDEVGLGKTIESCLILHRLLLTGRVQRLLILVPESLVHQWFVELLRRFNLWFSIFDEERCAAIEQHDPDGNPFRENQLILASLDLLAKNEARALQAIAAGWDLLVVDEAHHLRWSPDAPSVEYRIVEALARATPGILLLTATPEQLGEASHFARLRLLDPERFQSLERYLAEHSHYETVAAIGAKLLAGEPLSIEDARTLESVLSVGDEELKARLSSPEGRQAVLQRLLDQHGTGRVMFRNTRASMSGFPRRIADLVPLPPASAERLGELHEEFETDADPGAPKPFYDFDDDARILWLADFLRANPEAKVLLLCRYFEKVEMIEGALRGQLNAKSAVFHEKLPLIQRDRNAAWFAEEDGAQILICSEIGSEGRNFQFSHHLVLFDLPLDPELLEQRIGRLDRIGQREDITVHVPYIRQAPQELLARWYHEGMNVFEKHFSGGAEMGEKLHDEVLRVALEEAPGEDFERLLQETRQFRLELETKLHSGRDRLLELHSFNQERAQRVIDQISAMDADLRLDRFLTDAFDHFGLQIEDVGNRTFHLGGGDLFHDKIPALPEEGMTATADRTRALSRENVGFLTWDHPILTSMLDMLLGSEQGNSAFALWPGAPEGGVLVETMYVLETQAPSRLQLDRFLPPTPLRIVLNHKRKELGPEAAPEVLATLLKNGDPAILAAQMEEFGTLVPGMLRVTEIIAGKQSKPLAEAALVRAREGLGGEIARLEQLRLINPSIRPDEIAAAKTELAEVEQHLVKATPRLDSVRLILASTNQAQK